MVRGCGPATLHCRLPLPPRLAPNSHSPLHSTPARPVRFTGFWFLHECVSVAKIGRQDRVCPVDVTSVWQLAEEDWLAPSLLV